MFKPEFTTLEACHRLALSEGRLRTIEEEVKKVTVNEKLTPIKIIAIVVLTTLGVLGYCAILIFSLPFTGNFTTSWILSLAYAGTIIALGILGILRKRRRVTTK